MLRYTPICSCSKCCFHHVRSVTRVQLVKRNTEIGMLLNQKENNDDTFDAAYSLQIDLTSEISHFVFLSTRSACKLKKWKTTLLNVVNIYCESNCPATVTHLLTLDCCRAGLAEKKSTGDNFIVTQLVLCGYKSQ